MKTLGVSQRCPTKVSINGGAILLVAVSLLFLFVEVALGASGGEKVQKGWAITDTYWVINFAVLAIALFFLLRKPVSRLLNARIKGIEDQLGELEEKKKKAAKELAEYSEKLSLLDREAKKLIAEYVKLGNEARARIIKEAESAAKKLEEQAHQNIEYEFKQAKLKLQEDIVEKALIKAEETIKGKITAKDQDRLVDEYLKKAVA